MEAHVTVTEAAALLGLTRSGILHLIRGGRLKAERFGPILRLRRAAVLRLRERPGRGRPKKTPAAPRADRRKP